MEEKSLKLSKVIFCSSLHRTDNKFFKMRVAVILLLLGLSVTMAFVIEDVEPDSSGENQDEPVVVEREQDNKVDSIRNNN